MSAFKMPEWVTRPQRERWKFDWKTSQDEDGRYTGPNVNSAGLAEWEHGQQQDSIQRDWTNKMARFQSESSQSCALCGDEATHRRFIGPDTVDDGFDHHKWATVGEKYGFECLAHFVQVKGMSLDYCYSCSRRIKDGDSGDEIVTHYSLGRDALASDHKVWMAGNREAGAYRGDQEWGFMDGWSEATIDRYYENRTTEAQAVNDRNWDRAAGIDFDKVEAQMVATYGYVPERFGGEPE
jgi:hypothetical protein